MLSTDGSIKTYFFNLMKKISGVLILTSKVNRSKYLANLYLTNFKNSSLPPATIKQCFPFLISSQIYTLKYLA
ncbi:hypothetical protein JGI24_01450 [Candidatus Kryptobacter tengchongensis]|uniref:Uncharacterized protein n=1 Tax=Kryptobacter tengchongensis TaxID=1643429 RepID=A0A656DBP9_KRYT1|nr:hypothetical protein JGI24_01450 [Candidatus Kryptobacter tengchongensis]